MNDYNGLLYLAFLNRMRMWEELPHERIVADIRWKDRRTPGSQDFSLRTMNLDDIYKKSLVEYGV